MTTKFLDNKNVALSKFYCRGVSHEKQRFWMIFLSAPTAPPPLKSEIFIFIVVSPSLILPFFQGFLLLFFSTFLDLSFIRPATTRTS